MIFDTITLILGAAIIILAVLTSLLSPFRRDKLIDTPKNQSAEEESVENLSAEDELTETLSEPVSTDEANQAPLPSGESRGGSDEGNATTVGKAGGGCLPLTLLITVQQKQAQMLERHLPQFLSQDYAPGFEVVVVAEKGDSDTEDVLNRYAGNPLL